MTVRLRALFGEAGIPRIEIRTPAGTARFPSIEAWVHLDVKGWTLANLIDDAPYQTLLKAAQREFRPYVQRDGTVSFPHPRTSQRQRKAERHRRAGAASRSLLTSGKCSYIVLVRRRTMRAGSILDIVNRNGLAGPDRAGVGTC